jgi:hypothetical protein
MEVWRMTHIRSFLLIAVMCSAIASCVTTQKPKSIRLFDKFSVEDAQIIKKPGSGSIKVQAFMRQNGGGIVTAAGREITLLPHTTYTNQRLYQMYAGRRYIPVGEPKPVYESDPSDYYKLTRTQTADASGSTTFKNVADGRYFIATSVVWQVGQFYEGGAVYGRVTVKDGEAVEVIIAR